MTPSIPRYEISQTANRVITGTMVFGLICFLLGLLIAPDRAWSGFLIAEYYLIGLGMGATFFIAIQYVTNGGWATSLRRIPEAMSATLPYAAAGALLLILGIHTLYEWSHEAVVAQDPMLQEKAAWLNVPFFVIRIVAYFAIWIGLSYAIRKNSLRQDADPDLAFTHKNVRNSAIFILVGVYTFCLASFDLLMSLQPHWYSTVFGFQNLAGSFLTCLAMIAVLIVVLRRAGYGHIFTIDQLQTVGTMMLAFCIFWVYLWVSQHMLIWYSNIPEETTYYVYRHFGGWGTLSTLNVICNWLIPFFVLMPRVCKRNERTMLQVSLLILVGHWLDLYIMVMPATTGAIPTFSIWDIGPAVGLLALFARIVINTLGKHNLTPINDPYLVESLPQGHASHDDSPATAAG